MTQYLIFGAHPKVVSQGSMLEAAKSCVVIVGSFGQEVSILDATENIPDTIKVSYLGHDDSQNIILSNYKHSISANSNTQPIKDTLKSLGGS